MGHPAGHFGRIYEGLEVERPSADSVPAASFEQWLDDCLAERREHWADGRAAEILEVLHGVRADTVTIAPCWAFAPLAERCLVWDDFAQWVVETHTNSNDTFVRLIRRAAGHLQIFDEYATARAQWECSRLPSDYFEE